MLTKVRWCNRAWLTMETGAHYKGMGSTKWTHTTQCTHTITMCTHNAHSTHSSVTHMLVQACTFTQTFTHEHTHTTT